MGQRRYTQNKLGIKEPRPLTTITHMGTILHISVRYGIPKKGEILMQKRILVLTLALLILLTSCGGGASATTMHLRKTEGTVDVSDGEGKGVELLENLGLYSGYGVDTSSESYAWIDLDDVKLVKLDQNSEISITKEDKKLEVEVKSGSLFFNVTQPLADGESMNIRTSTMMLGIRGTCGWVVSNGDRGAQVFLLEGTMEAKTTGTGETVQVTAGNMAAVTVNENGETKITVQPFAEEHIVPFVLTELENDATLSAAVLAASGLDVLNPPDPAQRLREAYQEIIAQQTIYDHYAGAGATYTASGINYSADTGLSESFLSDLDGDGTQELIMIFRFYDLNEWEQYHDVYNSAPIQKIEVYGQSMGYPALYDTLDVTACRFDDGYYANQYRLIENGAGQTIQLYANYGGEGVLFENFWHFSFENGTFNLLENYREPQESDWDWLSNEDESGQENLCPAFPDDVRRKQALLSAFVRYEGYTDGYDCIYARLIDVNQDGGDELFMILDRTNDGLRTEYYTWDGTDLDCTVLASEPGDVVYGKLIDMDQDGAEELLLIMDDTQAIAYSWKGTSWERTLIHEEVLTFPYEGLYRDTVTGDVFLYNTEWRHIGEGEGCSFNGLTERFEYYYSAGDFSANGNFFDELTPDEQEEFYQAYAEYERNLDRFELIESIPDLYQQGNNVSEFYEQLQPTVDEVRQQLMTR